MPTFFSNDYAVIREDLYSLVLKHIPARYDNDFIKYYQQLNKEYPINRVCEKLLPILEQGIVFNNWRIFQ